MQRRRYSSRSHRRLQLVLLATASLFGSGLDASADSPLVEVSSAPIPAERVGNEVELQAPTNSTLEIRIARRPWLFDKLLKPSPPPSVKMNPPRPPAQIAADESKRISNDAADRAAATDPPSKSLIVPSRDQEGDGWIARGKRSDGITFADLSDGPEAKPPVPSSKVEESSESDGWFQNSTRQLREPKIVDTQAETNGTTGNDSNVESNTADVDAPEVDAPDIDAPDVNTTDVNELDINPPNADPPEAEAGTETQRGEVSDRSPQAASSRPDAGRTSADRESRVPSLDVAQQDSDVQPLSDPETEPPPEPTTRVESTSAATESRAAKSNGAASPASESKVGDEIGDEVMEAEVQVRKLRIEPDGSPVGDAGDRGEARREKTGSKSGTVSRSVGDLPSGETVSDDQAESSGRVSSDSIDVDLEYTGRPREPIRLTNTVARMKNAMKSCLRYYYSRPENANERSNWGMLHSIMVFGADTKIVAGSKTYSAIAWIAGNNSCRGKKLIESVDGGLSANSGIGLQGHQAQMLAVFALCDVPAEYPLYAGDQKYSIQDLIEAEMLACRSGEELTFTLIGLSHYLDTDAVWRNAEGELWDFERLLREELAQPIVGAACGGTHRLMGYAHALRKRRAEGGPMTGQWKRAEVYSQDFIRYVYRLQNRDGSMSTDWFEGREDNGDIDRKIQTTGHMVEWLLTITPDDQLQDRRLVSAVRFLLSSMYNERTHEWKIGPKGHALRSLAMYYERVYQQGPAWRATGVANTRSNQRR